MFKRRSNENQYRSTTKKYLGAFQMWKTWAEARLLLAMVEAAGPIPFPVAFAGFLRWEELLKLRCADMAFNPEGMVIQITSSKTDQYREGASLVIARTGTASA